MNLHFYWEHPRIYLEYRGNFVDIFYSSLGILVFTESSPWFIQIAGGIMVNVYFFVIQNVLLLLRKIIIKEFAFLLRAAPDLLRLQGELCRKY